MKEDLKQDEAKSTNGKTNNCLPSSIAINNNNGNTNNKCFLAFSQLKQYGFAVVDSFLGSQLGSDVLQEVKHLYAIGLFSDGQVVKDAVPSQLIRKDKVLHVTGQELFCKKIGSFVTTLEKFLFASRIVPTNKQLGEYCLNKRTKAMIACYPGNGTYYRKHYDNPNGDTRRLTCVYYLNKDWDVNKLGGLLRIFPRDHKNLVANVAPLFDRLVLFWSDRRNPHEVLPAFEERFAITVWYCD